MQPALSDGGVLHLCQPSYPLPCSACPTPFSAPSSPVMSTFFVEVIVNQSKRGFGGNFSEPVKPVSSAPPSCTYSGDLGDLATACQSERAGTHQDCLAKELLASRSAQDSCSLGAKRPPDSQPYSLFFPIFGVASDQRYPGTSVASVRKGEWHTATAFPFPIC